MQEADIPDKAIDLATAGLPTLAGADVSQLVGMGDVIPSYGTLGENVVGAPAGAVNRMNRALFYLQRGDKMRALEYSSPGVLRNVLKARRYAQDGLRRSSGELIATPSNRDIVLQTLGINPLSISKAYELEEAKTTEKKSAADLSADYNRRLAQAMSKRDTDSYKKILMELRDRNAKAEGPEDRIVVDASSIINRVREMKGINTSVPAKFRNRFRKLEGVYK
jgi:hypothetical protein